MIERCGALTADAQREPTRRLLAKLEAVLTRLDLLDLNRMGSADTFLRLLGQDDLARQIDQVLADGLEPEDLRTWLFEARLILAGADHAG